MSSLEWYRSFVHVYRSGTVSAAARTLGLTQPAVSQHIAALEAALGQRLFERQPRHMQPTSGALRLYSRVVDAIEQLETVASGAGEAARPIRLGAPAELFEARLLPALQQLKPSLSLELTLSTANDLLDRLQQGTLDAVVSTSKRAAPTLSFRGLYEEQFWLVAAPGTKACGARGLARFARDATWIAYAPELPIIRRFLRQTLGQRSTLEPRLIVPDLRAVRRAVELGLGVSVLPDYLCRQALENGSLSLVHAPEEPVTNDLWWVTERRASAAPRLSELFDALRA